MPSTGGILINRAPVLTLWASVVAERLGHDADAALTLGKAVAGLTAQSKGRHLGIYRQAGSSEPASTPAASTPASAPAPTPAPTPRKSRLGEEFWITLCGRAVPAKRTTAGVRAVVKDAAIEPEQVRTYLEKAFGADLAAVRAAMTKLARALPPDELNDQAFGLYEKFRPAVAPGQTGWGQKGKLDLKKIAALAAGK